jgi:FkbM family methyltransferase
MVDIRKQLLSLGVEDSIIDLRGYGLAKNYFTYKNTSPFKIINSHYDEYEKVYSFLSDDRSKNVYLGVLNSKIASDNKYMEGISSPSQCQYFDTEVIKLIENEVVCDCGSYNGDTLETYVALSDGKYSKYIAIEADKDIYSELNKKIAKHGYKNIKTYNQACWNEQTVLKFEPALGSGHISGTGRISIQADTLDNILKDERVTLIKMDIEGAEEMALNGAHRVINENKPVLAICIYHSLDDYYKIPLILKGLDQNYRLFIRHYRDMVDTDS